MSLKEYDAAGGQQQDGSGDAPAGLPVATSYGAIALAMIVTSATNPRTSHNRAKLEELLHNRAALKKLREHLATFGDEDRKAAAQILGSDKLAGFVHSIYVQGVNQPILLRPIPPARLADTQPQRGEHRPDFEIVAGERRYFGSLLAGKDTVPAMVKAMTDQEALEFQLVENLQRDDLHEMEEAEGYERLCRDTGIAKEEIGAKIGKSRSYVYARLKLLELCQEARRAFYDGKLDASRALLIARIPDEKLQLKALKEFTAEGYGGTMSVRACQDWLQRNTMLRLDKATFKIASETLVPEAGSCRACPKRTGANPELFADVDGADVCTDPKCYEKKQDAHELQITAEAEAKGLKVITGKEAKELRPNSWNDSITGYLDLDKPLPGQDKPLRKVLGKDAPEPTVFIDPITRQARDVLPAAVANKLLKAKGVDAPFNSSSRESAEEKAKREAKDARAREKAFVVEESRRRALRQISTSIRQGRPNSLSAPVLRALSLLLLTQADMEFGDDVLLDAWGLPAIGKPDDDGWKVQQERREALERHVQAAPDTDQGCMLLQLLMSTELQVSVYALENDKAESPFITQLAIESDVDLVAIEKDVKAERKAVLKEAAEKAAAKKAKKEGTATPSAAQAKGEPEGKAPAGAKKGRGAVKVKTSIEEATTGIADAMQNIDSASAMGFHVGQQVRFKQDLKSAGGKLRKVSGREGTIKQAIGDRAFSVKFGEKAHEVATADYTELEAVEVGSDPEGAAA